MSETNPIRTEQRVLIIEDLPEMAELMLYQLQEHGYDVIVEARGADALVHLKGGFRGVVILDLRLPDYDGLDLFHLIREQNADNPIVIVSAHATFDLVAEAIRNGAFDFVSKAEDFVPRMVAATKNAQDTLDERLRACALSDVEVDLGRFSTIVGRSPSMLEAFRKIERIVDLSVTVLITGETGTGKEIVARAIHDLGPRARGPFIALNCGAIPEHLLESELFGHEKGAFTGAVARTKGKFELANGGTILLDEIGEMDLNLQSKILRVLQERAFERVGGAETLEVDVRILSATNRNLIAEVEAGRFRRDLYYRLAVFPILLPPLRKREGDVERLVEHFIHRFGEDHGKDLMGITKAALQVLENYLFPGNVRELENVVSHACVVVTGDVIDVVDLPDFVRTYSGMDGEAPVNEMMGLVASTVGSLDEVPRLADVEALLIRRAVDLCSGNITLAARQLGISRATMYRRLHQLGIQPGS